MTVLRTTLLLAVLTMLSGCITPFELFGRIEKKTKKFYYLEDEHKVLQKKYEQVVEENVRLRYQVQHLRAAVETKKTLHHNRQLAGAEHGKRLSAIKYTVPSDLSMAERHQLAHTFYKKGEYAKAAKVYESFLYVPEGAKYHFPESFFQAGVTWYKLHNLSRARENFMSARVRAKGIRGTELLQRIDLWMKVLDKEGQGWKRETASQH